VVTLQVADSVLQVLFFFVAVIQQCVMSNKAQVEHKKANYQGAKSAGGQIQTVFAKDVTTAPGTFWTVCSAVIVAKSNQLVFALVTPEQS
jgi:hypothetical protein